MSWYKQKSDRFCSMYSGAGLFEILEIVAKSYYLADIFSFLFHSSGFILPKITNWWTQTMLFRFIFSFTAYTLSTKTLYPFPSKVIAFWGKRYRVCSFLELLSGGKGQKGAEKASYVFSGSGVPVFLYSPWAIRLKYKGVSLQIKRLTSRCPMPSASPNR